MLHTECFFFFYFICARVERVTELAHTPTHSAQGSLSGTSYSTVSLISIAMQVFFPSPPWTLEGPRRKEKKKKNPVVYVHFLSVLIVWGGTWTVIPAENNTSFSPVKPSVRPHHREQALRIRDIISLPGKVAHSIFPATLHYGVVLWRRWGRGKKEKICVSVAPKHIAGLH